LSVTDSRKLHSQGMARPKSAWPRATSRRTKPAPPHRGQTASLETCASSASAGELFEAADDLGPGGVARARISSSLFTLSPFRRPTLKNSDGVAPGTLVQSRRLSKR